MLADDRAQTSTLRDHVEGEGGGRFAELARREGASRPTVVGADPAANYPAGPAWTRAAVGIEPPLGVAIDAMEPVGEAFEIEASLAASVAPASVASSQRPDDAVETDAANPHSHERLAEILPHIAKPRRKL